MTTSTKIGFKIHSQNITSFLLTIRSLLKSTIILLPLLGLTWVFGLLAVNQNTIIFAWIFTILNSFQVLGIPFTGYLCR